MVFRFVLTTIIVFLSEWIQEKGFVKFPLGFRHVLISFTVGLNWLISGKTLKLDTAYKSKIILLFVYLLISFYFSKATFFNYGIGAIFSCLFIFLFILSANTKANKNLIVDIFIYLLLFFSVMSIISIVQSLTAGSSLRDYSGLFRELGAFGSVMNICTIISISLYLITSNKFFLFLALFFSFGVMLTILKKSIISNIFVWLFYLFHQNKRIFRYQIIGTFGIIFLVSSFFVGEELNSDIGTNSSYLENVGPTEHVRLGMFIASYHIATDYFPFGSGPGTFGSLSSIINGYSEVHYDYGVAYIGSNSPEDILRGNHTLLDTYWPHILGEFGFLGTLLFLLIWWFPLKKAFSFFKSSDDPFIKGISFYVLIVIVCMTWEGFTLYTPEIPSFILIHSGLTGLCYYHIKSHKLNVRAVC
jgi:hypothetical protein